MKKRIATNLLIVLVSISLMLILLEAVVRIFGQVDQDGQFTFMGHDLHPHVLPVKKMSARINEYLEVREWSAIKYDATLGWTFAPDTVRQSGIFTVNRAGFRSIREHDPFPPADTLRIALFGDSFTAGEDVNDFETWGHSLEILINEAGIRAEVLNFGVSAHGMDQAFLRWQKLGRSYDPDIVIFGLQPENLKRNVNVFRQVLNQNPAALPFSKPRFVLVDDELDLKNVPVLPTEQLIDVFENFDRHPLAAYEYHYGSRDVVSAWWASIRLASLMYSLVTQSEDRHDIYAEESEAGQLGKAIIDAFATDVIAQDSTFIVLHLPLRSHLIRYYSNLPRPLPPYEFLLSYCREAYHFIDGRDQIDPSYIDDAYWTSGGHYGPAVHALIAQQVADSIISCVTSGTCILPRFEDPAILFSVQ